MTSNTTETDAQLTTFESISKLKKRFVNKTGTVGVEFTRNMERERDEARRLAQWFYTRLKQVCLDHPLEGNVGGILARLEEAVLDDPWLEAAK
jgi:hypothetical protein